MALRLYLQEEPPADLRELCVNMNGGLTNALRGIMPLSGTSPDPFHDWYSMACLPINIQTASAYWRDKPG